jgi:hypothetical protein
MAVVLENSQLVWKKVKNALANANPAAQDAFLALRKYLSTQGRNPDLQFIAFSEAQAIVAAGTDLTGAACKVYGVYAKAAAARSGTTSAFLDFHAAASDAATTTVLDFRIKAAGQIVVYTNPRGVAFETGLTVHSATAVGGTVDTTTPDGADGFVVIGAA